MSESASCMYRVHRGRSDTAANANANSDAPRQFASEFWPPNLKQKAANWALRRNSLANANGFANEMAKFCLLLKKFLANGHLRQNSLAIANAMAWCTQVLCISSVCACAKQDIYDSTGVIQGMAELLPTQPPTSYQQDTLDSPALLVSPNSELQQSGGPMTWLPFGKG